MNIVSQVSTGSVLGPDLCNIQGDRDERRIY